MHLQIVIDDGSNFIKTAHKIDGGVVTNVFPSRVTRGPIIDANFQMSSGTYRIGNNVYSVSETTTNTVPTNDSFYQSSEINRVLIHHALREAGATSADIILTLPVSQFLNHDKTKNTANIEAKKLNAMGSIDAENGTDCCTIKSVVVMPEGVPAFSNIKGSMQLENGSYLMVDIGGTTTDMIAFNKANQITDFKSFNIGVLKVLNTFKSICTAIVKSDNISDYDTLHGFLNESLGGVDFSDEVGALKAKFQHDLNDHIRQLGDTALLDSIIYSGGGSQLLNMGPNDTRTEQPQLDNALGCLNIFKDE